MGIAWKKMLSEGKKKKKKTGSEMMSMGSSFIQNNPNQTSINQKQKKMPKCNLFSLKAGFLFIFI